jgi:hypothetical protein
LGAFEGYILIKGGVSKPYAGVKFGIFEISQPTELCMLKEYRFIKEFGLADLR